MKVDGASPLTQRLITVAKYFFLDLFPALAPFLVNTLYFKKGHGPVWA